MEKKQYTAPTINIFQMESTSIMAGSGGGISENANGEVKGNLGEVKSNGDAGTAHVASRIYFDSWGYDDED